MTQTNLRRPTARTGYGSSGSDLVHVFDGDGTGRGMHSGEFRWQSSIGLIMGRLAGITNAGTHRPPVFNECQRCRDAVMEGQFQGTVCRPRSPEFSDCQVFGAYRLRIDPGRDGLPAPGPARNSGRRAHHAVPVAGHPFGAIGS